MKLKETREKKKQIYKIKTRYNDIIKMKHIILINFNNIYFFNIDNL